jgi:glycosyltransferase involved in cell wall biosynthesis
MTRRIIYLPLEPVKERYTIQLSAARTGWLERNWLETGIEYVRIEGTALRDTIRTGQVLDATNRGYWATSQIQKLLAFIDEGRLRGTDVIYFDDFWHPGMSAIKYACTQLNHPVKMYAFLWAQSVDQFDFTHKMKDWMRPFEIGISTILDGIFVTSTALKKLCVDNGVGTEEKVHVTGLPYNSREVRDRFAKELLPPKRIRKQVVYSSRWDSEKRPELFLEIIERTLQYDPEFRFVVTTSAEKLRSNDPNLLAQLEAKIRKYPHHIELRENQTKEAYYRTLQESEVQINTADQDWVSWTLLEATTAGCKPLYPEFLSFPEALEFDGTYMYEKGNADSAARKLVNLCSFELFGGGPTFYRKYDMSWYRMFRIMNGKSYDDLYRSPDTI